MVPFECSLYLGVVFRSDGRKDGLGDGLIDWGLVLSTEGVASVGHGEESCVELKLLIYWSVHIPFLTCGHEVWIKPERA